MIEFFFEKNASVDDWQDDSYGVFAPSGWCIFGISYTGWEWHKHGGKWQKRSTRDYWRLGIVLLNIGFGIWFHRD